MKCYRAPLATLATLLICLACSSPQSSQGSAGAAGQTTDASGSGGGGLNGGSGANGGPGGSSTSLGGVTGMSGAGSSGAGSSGAGSSGAGSGGQGFGGSVGTGGSAAAGASGSLNSGAAGGATGAPIFVAVGYAGRRIRSTDLGVTWADNQTLGGGGDDEFLLRAVTFGKGVFVALGWKILTSPDGKTWQPRTNPQSQWFGGAVFANGRFVATGGAGYSANSTDGIAWAVAGDMPNGEASRSLAFGMNEFVTATDPGNWYRSSDGNMWTLLSGNHATSEIDFCNGAFSEASACSGAFNGHGRATAQGTTIRLQSGKLERSTNGQNFSPVAGSPDGLEDVTVGYAQ